MEKKELYLSKSITGLTKLTDTSKVEYANVKMICRLLGKLFENYEKANLDKDEELCFVYLMRFLEIYSKARKVFKGDIKYIDAVVNSSKVSRALESAEKTKKNLMIRYENLNKEVEIKENGLKNDENCNLNSTGLYKAIREKENVLIVDVRERKEFESCHIIAKCFVNVSCDIIGSGSSVTDVDDYVSSKGSEAEKISWKNRSTAKVVLMVDWDETRPSLVNDVKDAIYKWDARHVISVQPVQLNGGLKSFMAQYPTMVTDSRYEGPNEKSVKLDNIDVIIYPNLDKPSKTVDTPFSSESESDKENDEKIADIDEILVSPNNPSPFIDRSLKPNALRTKDTINAPIIQIETDKENSNQLEKDHLTSEKFINPSLQVDRSKKPEFSKATDNTAVYQSLKPPPWIKKEVDPTTGEIIFIDHKTGLKYSTLSSALEENVIMPSKNEMDKPFKKIIQTTESKSNLKRSPSQPNLSGKSNSQAKLKDESSMITNHVNSATVINDSTPSVPLRSIKPPNNNSTTNPSTLFCATEEKVRISITNFTASQIEGFDPVYRIVKPGVTGLRNLGNTCYMSSIIHALSNTKLLACYLLQGNYKADINASNPLGHGGHLVEEFGLLVRALWSGKYSLLSPTSFRRVVQQCSDIFRGGGQQDSQEFLLFLLDGLHEDLNTASSGSVVNSGMEDDPNGGDGSNDSVLAENAWNKHLLRNDSVIVRFFQGLFRSRVRCDHCGTSSVTFEAFMYLSLPIPSGLHQRCTLAHCIALFLEEERMTGASQWHCPRCKRPRNATKRIDIWRLPPYLLIHLKRFSCIGSGSQHHQKLGKYVDFELDQLELSSVLPDRSNNSLHHTYHLYGVSNHHGSMESGHYTSYCRNFQSGRWYNYDDDHVNDIRSIEVKSPSAYILFYESYNVKQAVFRERHSSPK